MYHVKDMKVPVEEFRGSASIETITLDVTAAYLHTAVHVQAVYSGFICGKKSTALIESELVMIIERRSIPIPIPAVGGIPYSIARRKSSSTVIASSSPPARSRACSSNLSR